MKLARQLTLLFVPFLATTLVSRPYLEAQAPPASPASAAPGQPGSNYATPIGIFDGQSDLGSAAIQGSATYDAAKQQYTVDSAGYNVTFTRDQFRYLWKKMSGDVALSADIAFPNPNGYDGRKAMLVIRQSLEDDSKEAVVAVYGTGMFTLAQRPGKGVARDDMQYRVWGKNGSGSVVMPNRVRIEKRGDVFILYVSMQGEPMHAFGPPLMLRLNEPFYVGIGFCSNLPDKSDAAIFANVVVESYPSAPSRPGQSGQHRAAFAPTPLPTRTIP